MEKRIYEAAKEGDVISLYNLLQEDALLLDRYIVGCYAETPLHIASMLGHVEFVREILTRKPELAGEFDYRKSTPLHLATAKGFLDIVKMLVSVNPEMCFARDRDGRNPLHIASIKGHVNVLRELVQARLHAARSLMDRGETILHVCVRYNQLEALSFLLEAISDYEFVNCKDDDGNSILHLAVIDKQVETVKFLSANDKIEVNALNASGITAVDILKQSIRDVKYWEIGEMLRLAGGTSAREINLAPRDLGIPQTSRSKILKSRENKHEDKGSEKDEERLEKKRNSLIVVASLIATMGFQAGLTPPGGLWQGIADGNSTSTNSTEPHKVGSPILADEYPSTYDIFIITNTIGYAASLFIILLLISGLPFFKRWFFMGVLTFAMWVAILAIGLTYLISITAPTARSSVAQSSTLGFVVLVGMDLIVFLFLGHVIRFIVWIIKKARRYLSPRGHGPHPSV